MRNPDPSLEVAAYNREAWDRLVEQRDRWTVPVSSATIEAARRGDWQVVLTPVKPVPHEWFGAIDGRRILCLASGGGQQGPTLAAAGAGVTVLDNAPRQLEQDRRVAARDGLELELQLGRMDDLAIFGDRTFDLIFHPVSNLFVPDVRPVWKEAQRVLRPGGRLLSGFANPVLFMFDAEAEARGELIVRHTIPYSDVTSRSAEELARLRETGEPLEFGHSLDDLIGGQIEAGFVIAGFYEDGFPGHVLDRFLPPFIATLAVKP